jgi:SOS-response transcriptional repressor LexA
MFITQVNAHRKHHVNNALMHEVTRRLYLAAIELKGARKLTSIAHLLGEKPQTVKNWETRGVSQGGQVKARELIGCDTHWLATGEGAMRANGIAKSTAANTEPGPDLRGRVPLISWVRAGDWCSAADPHQPGQADAWMQCPVKHSSSTFALRVRGDSMTAPHGNSRSYPEGCIIFVDPEQRNPLNGDRVVACLEGTDEVTFKTYKHEDGRQWLQPLNPAHEPIRAKFRVLGKVLGKWEDG